MFLHAGAGMHGHEFSHDTRSNSLPSRAPALRPAFSNPLPRRASAYGSPSPNLRRLTEPMRPVSEYIPHPSDPVIRLQESDMDTMSEDGGSFANSEGSEATIGGSRRRRRSTRTSTVFHLAHPAPTLTQKQRLLLIRPKLLLQLQRVSTESRPKPAVDVLPSTVVVPRLVKKFPRMFRGKAALGANDVMVVKSEEYDKTDDHAVEDADSDEEGLANRDLMAVICQVGKSSGGSQGCAEIVLSDGSVWVATPLPNGIYQFITTDERGNKITARWVRRSKRRNTMDSPDPNDFKFTFSIIDPNSRRHPIMASITNNKLDIPDSYTSVSSSTSKHPPTSSLRGLPNDSQIQSAEEPHPERTTHVIDDNMKVLIQVTGVWVALRQGVSPYFKYNDAMALAAESPTVQRSGSVGSKRRSLTITTTAGQASPVGTASSTPESTQSFFGGKIRQKYVKGSPFSTASAQVDQGKHPQAKRSVSNGSAFMQRAAARRAGNLPSTVTSDSEGEVLLYLAKQPATGSLPGSFTNQISASKHRSLTGSSSATPVDTPTKPQRRTQSVYLPPTTQQNTFTNDSLERHSVEVMDGKNTPVPRAKTKTSRWKTFKEFLRRTHSSTRSG